MSQAAFRRRRVGGGTVGGRRAGGRSGGSGGDGGDGGDLDAGPAATRLATSVGLTQESWQAAWEKTWWCPPLQTGFMLLAAVRVLGAVLNPVSDCDETFNFWEPTHYMMYGRGFQTWEYSPEYGLHTYLYTGVHAVIGVLGGSLWGASKVDVFYHTRVALGLACAGCEALFYSSVGKRFGPFVGATTLWLLLASAGMFHASSAFLASSFTMYCVMLGYAAWFSGHVELAVGAGAMAAVVGWPFAGVLWVPMGLAMILDGHLGRAVVAGVLATAGFTVLCVLVDTMYFGTPVLAFWNIIKYNVLGQGGDGSGSELYGVEPWTYYVANLFLNLNFVAVLANGSVLAPVLMAVRRAFPPVANKLGSEASAARTFAHQRDTLVTLSAMWVWYAILGTRPHKEERFMFVVYPTAAFAGAVLLREAVLLFHGLKRVFVTKKNAPLYGWSAADIGVYVFVAVVAVVSLSRVGAVLTAYRAPLSAYSFLSDKLDASFSSDATPTRTIVDVDAAPAFRVCVGKEWYRFPSSHFLPDHSIPPPLGTDTSASSFRRPGSLVELAFLKSDFGGQLPQPFLSAANGGTAAHGTGFNDANREEPDRYVDVSTCDYVVDFELPEPHNNPEPYFAPPATAEDGTVLAAQEWVTVWSQPFLHAPSSPAWSRAFYVPGLSNGANVYGNYVVKEHNRNFQKPSVVAKSHDNKPNVVDA